MMSPQRRELLMAAFAAAVAERQAQHHGTYKYVCDIDGDLVFTHQCVGEPVRRLT